VTPTTPAVSLLFQQLRFSFGDGGNALDASLLGSRISARLGGLTVNRGLLANLGQENLSEMAESKLTVTATHNPALYPAAE